MHNALTICIIDRITVLLLLLLVLLCTIVVIRLVIELSFLC